MNSRNYAQKYNNTCSKLKKINKNSSISYIKNNSSTKKFQFKPHHHILNLTPSNSENQNKKQIQNNSKIFLKINNKFINTNKKLSIKNKNNINCYNSENINNFFLENSFNYKKINPKLRAKSKSATKNNISEINNIINKTFESYPKKIYQISFKKNNKKNNTQSFNNNNKKYFHLDYSPYFYTSNKFIEIKNKTNAKRGTNYTMNNITINNNNFNINTYNKYYDYLLLKIDNLKKEIKDLKNEKNELLNTINNSKVEQKKYDYVLNIKKDISYQRNIIQKIMQIHQNYKSEINNINIQLKV